MRAIPISSAACASAWTVRARSPSPKLARDGNLTIENFELGVCLDQASWRFGDLAPFTNTKDAATGRIHPRIAAIHPLRALPAAMQSIADRRAIGKVLIDVRN